jgi:AAA+ ATPase superfamily predicted ATPase
MKSKFIAREKELDVLNSALARSSSSFMTIYGRRRIGKTKTVIHFCQHNDLPYLEFTGKYDQNRTQQIQGFVNTLEDAGANVTNPINDWTSAFRLLQTSV